MTDAETEAQAPAPTAVPDAKLAAINGIIARWMADQINNSPVSQSTAAINHLRSKLPMLASALDKEL